MVAEFCSVYFAMLGICLSVYVYELRFKPTPGKIVNEFGITLA